MRLQAPVSRNRQIVEDHRLPGGAKTSDEKEREWGASDVVFAKEDMVCERPKTVAVTKSRVIVRNVGVIRLGNDASKEGDASEGRPASNFAGPNYYRNSWTIHRRVNACEAIFDHALSLLTAVFAVNKVVLRCMACLVMVIEW